MSNLKEFSETYLGKMSITVLAALIIGFGGYYFNSVTSTKANNVEQISNYNLLNQKIDNYTATTDLKIRIEKKVLLDKLDSVQLNQKRNNEALNEMLPLLNKISETQSNHNKILKQVCNKINSLNNLTPFLETSEK